MMHMGMTAGVVEAQSKEPGCRHTKAGTNCNWEAFAQVLAATQTVAVEYEKLDRPTGKQLPELVMELGKKAADRDNPGQLTFVVVEASSDGILYGPSDQPLSELRIYSGGNSNGKLLWVETFPGQADIPWGAMVHGAIAQFQARLAQN